MHAISFTCLHTFNHTYLHQQCSMRDTSRVCLYSAIKHLAWLSVPSLIFSYTIRNKPGQHVNAFSSCQNNTTAHMFWHSLYNKTNEMHFLEFYSDNIIYMFRIGKLFIFRRQFYCTCSLWYVSCIHADLLLPPSRPWFQLVHMNAWYIA